MTSKSKEKSCENCWQGHEYSSLVGIPGKCSCSCHDSSSAGWEDKLQHWIKTQFGTAGCEMKFENLIRELIAQRDAELVERLQILKKQDADLSPGFNITAEYRLGELRGSNTALDEALQITKGKKDV